MNGTLTIDSGSVPAAGRRAAAPAASADHGRGTLEFDLHGTVGIRLVGADAQDAAGVARQLGPIRVTLDRAPDITIRFVDRLAPPGSLRYLGVGEAAFSGDEFYILRGKHKARVRVKIPFDQIGDTCEIVCERGARSVPLLIAIINLTALAKGVLPLHASAFAFEGTGVLTTGWSKGGKTEALLAYMSRGASYVGDEWVYVSADGRRMHGIPEPVRLWDWHLRQLDAYRAQVPVSVRARIGAANLVRAVDSTLAGGRWAATGPARSLRRIMPAVERRACVDVPAEKLFGADACSGQAQVDKLLFVASRECAGIEVKRIAGAEIARRMVFSLQEERRALMSYYRTFCFAFPGRRNGLIEHAEEVERDLTLRALGDREAYAVEHPYPFSLSELFSATVGLLRVGREVSS